MKAAILGLATALCLAPVAQACCCVPHYSSVTKREFKKNTASPYPRHALIVLSRYCFFHDLFFCLCADRRHVPFSPPNLLMVFLLPLRLYPTSFRHHDDGVEHGV